MEFELTSAVNSINLNLRDSNYAALYSSIKTPITYDSLNYLHHQLINRVIHAQYYYKPAFADCLQPHY